MMIPPINSKGKFKVSSPFDTILKPDIIYTVVGIRSIQEAIDDDIDVEKEIYVNNGLTADDMVKDMTNNIPIIILQDESNTYYYIPAKYFISIPDVSGYYLRDKILAIDLGLVPENEDLSYIIDEVKDLITSMTGLLPNGKLLDGSQIVLVDKQKYDTYSKNRESRINNKETCRAKLKKIDVILKEMRNKEKILVDRLTKLESNS